MVQQITVNELFREIENGHEVCLLDVREKWEHELASIPGSLLIPLRDLSGRISEIDAWQGKQVIVYCHHGIRSLSGARILELAGFGDVKSLSGGIDAWSCRVDERIQRY